MLNINEGKIMIKSEEIKKVLITPISAEDLADIKIGDNCMAGRRSDDLP